MTCRIRVLVLSCAALLTLLTACQGEESAPPVMTFTPSATHTPLATTRPMVTRTPTATVTPSPRWTPTITLTPTATATLGPSATHTLTPTTSHTPSRTPSPTASLTPVQLVVESTVGGYVRSGPNTNYPVVGEVDAAATFDALAYTINEEGDAWYLIRLPDGTLAWISQWIARRVDDVPLGLIAQAVTVPASPTPLPSHTPTFTPTFTPTATLPPGANARVYGETRVNLRSGPGLGFAQLGMMEPDAPLQLIGRGPMGAWFEVNTFDGRTGWVLGDLMEIYAVDTSVLPVRWVDANTPNGVILSADRLHTAYEIYQRGQVRGNRANTWMIIGDSTSAHTPEWFPLFYAFQQGTYDLGPYTNLRAAVNFYAPSGKFGASFQSAQSGFATDFVLDPMWANPSVCQAGESPLTCEIRLSQPAFAIIYIGIVDMANYNNPTMYGQNLETIVTTLIGSDVIPVLTTFAIDEGHAVNAPFLNTFAEQNAMIREIAARYHLPLIEFEEAARALPHHGTIEDGRHLYYHLDGSMDFSEDGKLGQALRERMTLQMMDALRLYIFGG